MTKTKHFNFIFLAIIFLILLLTGAEILSPFFRNITWYDIVLHFLGGAWISLSFFYFTQIKKGLFDDRGNFLFTLLVASSFVALIGVFWEFYEFGLDLKLIDVYGSLESSANPLADTIKDLAADLLGGVVAIVYYWKIIKTRP